MIIGSGSLMPQHAKRCKQGLTYAVRSRKPHAKHNENVLSGSLTELISACRHLTGITLTD